ncbi:efflux transporter outer membrane subunit [Comamonas testosteroni]|uniref:efflux transporter outer membrane subunit n=2 Tax=Comamonas testosteroni TaxID=285 RepID=UPI00076C5CE4|nr:efflux transporter outer membrane subunit [Comamonas testosteroni]KWT74447.1 RND efflux system, outer membrane lipoprotein, NodT family [Comamonas testosteroni]
MQLALISTMKRRPSCSWLRPIAIASSILSAALMLGACAIKPALEGLSGDPKVPVRWEAPLPDSDRITDLKVWWQSQSEPDLATLIDAANAVSPNVSSALARIEQAKALQSKALSSLLPELSGTASTARSRASLYSGIYVQNQAGVQVSWALDLASLRGAQSSAARADLESAQALWHDARTLVAAEVADLYYASRTCQRQSALHMKDAASHEQSVKMTQRSLKAGMASEAEMAAARYNAAEAMSLLQQQQATCDVQIKGLVALTGKSEPILRQLMQPAWEREGTPASFAVEAVPAQALAQRPDVYVAERDVLQAQARVMQAQANRLPRLSLEGFIGRGASVFGGNSTANNTWNFGPLALTLPIFDAGRRAAEQRAAEADLTATISAYHARVRQAVREVEEALVQLDSVNQRLAQSRIAAEQARVRLQSSEQLLQQGMLSSFELEELRRQARTAQLNALALDLAGQRAWTTLYRAVGGGFKKSSAHSEPTP